MVFSTLLQRFVEKRPIAVLAHMALENFFGADQFDRVFEDNAQTQYTRELLFSSVTGLLVQVTLCGKPSINAAFKRDQGKIPVSIAAVYDKLQGVEPTVCEALVTNTADKAEGLLKVFGNLRPEPIDGYRLRIGDGNVLARSQRRLKELRGSNTAALPGLSVALYEYASQTISRLRVCENAHTNERLLMNDLLPHLQPKDLFMADRNFAMLDFFQALDERQAGFLIRRHGSLKLTYLKKRHKAGRCQTGEVFYQHVRLSNGREYWAIVVERDQPLKKGGHTVILLTNLPLNKALALKLAALYLKRWNIEEAFRQLTEYLSCEINTLGYPKAALLAFSLAVVAYNCLACVKGALAIHFGRQKVEDELSMYYVALEVKLASDGLTAVVPSEDWDWVKALSVEGLAQAMREVAAHVVWQCYTKSRRGPKKPMPCHRKPSVHQATAKLLDARKETAQSP
jgi:hypothetical protein